MAQTVAHGGQLHYGAIQLFGLVQQLLPVYLGTPVVPEHTCDLVQRETRRPPQGDERQALQHAGRKLAPDALTAKSLDQPLLLVLPQRGRPQTGAFGDFGNVHEKTS